MNLYDENRKTDNTLYSTHLDDGAYALNPLNLIVCNMHCLRNLSILDISIFHGCMAWTEKSVTRVTNRHHEACRVMPNTANSYPE